MNLNSADKNTVIMSVKNVAKGSIKETVVEDGFYILTCKTNLTKRKVLNVKYKAALFSFIFV